MRQTKITRPTTTFVVVGAGAKLGGEISRELYQEKQRVFLISTKEPAWLLPIDQSKILIKVENYFALPSVLSDLIKNHFDLTIVYLLSTGGNSNLVGAVEQVIGPVVTAMALQGHSRVRSILISSGLANLVGFEKGLVYHLEKSALETAFRFYAVRDTRPTRLYNIIRLSHIKSRLTKHKYQPIADGGQGLKNLPRKALDVTDLSTLVETIRFLSRSDLLNGAIIDLDQGARFVSSVSEVSGYKDATERDWFFK